MRGSLVNGSSGFGYRSVSVCFPFYLPVLLLSECYMTLVLYSTCFSLQFSVHNVMLRDALFVCFAASDALHRVNHERYFEAGNACILQCKHVSFIRGVPKATKGPFSALLAAVQHMKSVLELALYTCWSFAPLSLKARLTYPHLSWRVAFSFVFKSLSSNHLTVLLQKTTRLAR